MNCWGPALVGPASAGFSAASRLKAAPRTVPLSLPSWVRLQPDATLRPVASLKAAPRSDRPYEH